MAKTTDREGRFFHELAGRDDGNFFEKGSMSSYSPGQTPSGGGINVAPKMGTGDGKGGAPKPGTEKLNIGATGGPVGGMGERGEGMSGGMYGTGDGAKTAGKTPNEWDADSGLPTGFHRATYEQPEGLEAGGERFHDTETSNPSFGVGKSVRHGLTETGGSSRPAGYGHQVGKHASASPPRFLGTSYGMSKVGAIKDYASKAEGYGGQLSSQGGDSLKELGRQAASTADKGLQAVTRSPIAMGVAALLAGKMGLRGLKGVGRGAKRLVRGKAKPRPQGLLGLAK